MKQEKTFLHSVCTLAVPVTLQSMLQASFSIVDQIMIGQLGSVGVAGVGLAGKFSSIFSVVVSAVGAVAGIMISQYVGQQNNQEVRRSFRMNLTIALIIAVAFTMGCLAFPQSIMGLYTQDAEVRNAAAVYLTILAGTFIPLAGGTLLATMFRCKGKASLPLYASVAAAICNTALNYVLIFGKYGVPALGTRGAAIATLLSQWLNLIIMLCLAVKYRQEWNAGTQQFQEKLPFQWKQYIAMLLPILVCELLWSLGENVYAGIYGHLGTDSCAAMTLINPIQGLMIGALCGLSQAAGIMIGKRLGNEEYEEAYMEAKKIMGYGLLGALILSVVIIFTKDYYVDIYQVEAHVKLLTTQILVAYAIIAPFKVQNMILGGGIIRSGGKTKYVMVIDMIGTWIFGVPLGLLAAFGWKLSIPYVYFILSLEECIRFGIGLVVFRRRRWMQTLQ